MSRCSWNRISAVFMQVPVCVSKLESHTGHWSRLSYWCFNKFPNPVFQEGDFLPPYSRSLVDRTPNRNFGRTSALTMHILYFTYFFVSKRDKRDWSLEIDAEFRTFHTQVTIRGGLRDMYEWHNIWHGTARLADNMPDLAQTFLEALFPGW